MGHLTSSWYGPGFHGRLTASGERYDMHGLTCAHKNLPFETRLRVTDALNGKSIEVVVNDRGPFIDGRELDLSYGAAKEIGIVERGVAKLRVERLKPDKRRPILKFNLGLANLNTPYRDGYITKTGLDRGVLYPERSVRQFAGNGDVYRMRRRAKRKATVINHPLKGTEGLYSG